MSSRLTIKWDFRLVVAVWPWLLLLSAKPLPGFGGHGKEGGCPVIPPQVLTLGLHSQPSMELPLQASHSSKSQTATITVMNSRGHCAPTFAVTPRSVGSLFPLYRKETETQ